MPSKNKIIFGAIVMVATIALYNYGKKNPSTPIVGMLANLGG